MAMLIDGYNLLRAIQKISENPALTDAQMCRMVSNYLRYLGQQGEIIFDGVGPRDKSVFFNMPVEITFAGSGVEADDIIEKRIADYSAPKLLIVVSSDRRIRLAAQKRKSIAVKAQEFWLAMEKFTAHSSKRKKRAEPRSKREGISESETELWLRIFGLKDEK